jgi:hypothetical protein
MMMQLVDRVEARWALRLPARELVTTVATVGDLVAFLREALAEHSGPLDHAAGGSSEPGGHLETGSLDTREPPTRRPPT